MFKDEADFEKVVGRLNIDTEPNPAHREKLRRQMLSVFNEAEQEPATRIIVFGTLRRIIMKSPITKLAAAAVIIIAVTIFINQLGDSSTRVAWGEVLDVMEEVPTVVFNMTNVTTFGDNKAISTESKVYDAGKYGNRIDMYMNGELVMQKYMLPNEKVAYMIQPKEKIYSRFVLSEGQTPPTEEDFPRQWVKIILSEDYTELGSGNINGIDVDGVEIHNSELLAGDEGVVRLWVDVETNLPVRMELEGKMMEAGAKRPMKIVMDDFQWDVEFDEGIFQPNIPDDYRLMEDRKGPQPKEKSRNVLTNEEKDAQPKVKEVARKLFQACRDKDWDEFLKLWPGLELNQMQKTYLGGLEIIHIGEPSKTDDSATWYVPYRIELKLGEVREKNLRVRYDETVNRFIACGGL